MMPSKPVRATLPLSANADAPHLGVNIHPAHPSPSLATTPGLDRLPADVAARAVAVGHRLKAYDAQVMAWLRAHPENAQKFVRDPIGTLREARLVPEDVLREAAEVGKAWPRPGTGTGAAPRRS